MPCMPRVFSTRSACSRSRLFLPFCPYTPDRRAAHHPQHKSQVFATVSCFYDLPKEEDYALFKYRRS